MYFKWRLKCKKSSHDNVVQIKIDPDIIYDVAGSGLPYCEKVLMREQVWDKVFERKTTLALKEVLEEEDLKAIETQE